MSNFQITPSANVNSLVALLARRRLNSKEPDSHEHLVSVVNGCPIAGRIHAALPDWNQRMSLDQASIILNGLSAVRLPYVISDAKKALNELHSKKIFVGMAPVSDVLDALYHAYGDSLDVELENANPEAFVDELTKRINPVSFAKRLGEYVPGVGEQLLGLETQILNSNEVATDLLNEFFELPEEQIQLLINARIVIGHHEVEYAKYRAA